MQKTASFWLPEYANRQHPIGQQKMQKVSILMVDKTCKQTASYWSTKHAKRQHPIGRQNMHKDSILLVARTCIKTASYWSPEHTYWSTEHANRHLPTGRTSGACLRLNAELHVLLLSGVVLWPEQRLRRLTPRLGILRPNSYRESDRILQI